MEAMTGFSILGCGSGLPSARPAERAAGGLKGLGIDAAPGAVALSARNARQPGAGGSVRLFRDGTWHDGLPDAPDPERPAPWNIVDQQSTLYSKGG